MALEPLYEIREEHSFARCVEDLGGYEYIDLATESLRWKLARAPVAHSFAVPPLKARVTFTEGFGELLPVFRVVIVIHVGPKLVSLEYIEAADDAPPFGFDDFLDYVE